jgi:hypothetical protein
MTSEQLSIMKNFNRFYDEKRADYDASSGSSYMIKPLHELLMLDWFLTQGGSTMSSTQKKLANPLTSISSAISKIADKMEEAFTSNKKEIVESSDVAENEPNTLSKQRNNVDFAESAKASLCTNMLSAIDKEHFPNILLMDNVDKSSLGWLTLSLNLKLALLHSEG